MKRVALYVRVSHEEQVKHGISVDAQIKALEEYSKANNYEIVKIYSDAGISARKSYKKRPALLEMISDCRLGKIDLILICKLDRFFRSVPDYYAVMEQIGDIPWKAIQEDYETETANGVFKVNIMLSVAQSEADRTGERIKNVFEYKKANGEYCGGNKAPIGYTRDGKKIDINPDEQEAVRAFFDAYLSTGSVAKSIDAARLYGLELNARKADRILTHPAYYGDVGYVLNTYITREEHERIEKLRSRHRRVYPTTKHEYIFSGLGRCGICGGSMVGCRTVRQNKNGTTGHSIRYVCRAHENKYDCSGSSISEKVLEQFLLDTLEASLENKYTLEAETSATNKNDKARIISNNKARLKRLRDLYELGDIELSEYKNKRQVLQAEIVALEKEPVKQITKLPPDWKDIYSQLDVDHKRAFWSSTFDYIEITGMCCKHPNIIF